VLYRFHADEVTACYMLSLLPEFKDHGNCRVGSSCEHLVTCDRFQRSFAQETKPLWMPVTSWSTWVVSMIQQRMIISKPVDPEFLVNLGRD
jgi:hypothetical protein